MQCLGIILQILNNYPCRLAIVYAILRSAEKSLFRQSNFIDRIQIRDSLHHSEAKTDRPKVWILRRIIHKLDRFIALLKKLVAICISLGRENQG